MPETLTRAVTLNSNRTNASTRGRQRTMHNHRSFFTEAYERFKSRRQTVKLLEGDSYNRLLATYMFQYFREDLGGICAVGFAGNKDLIAIGFNSGELKVCKPHILDSLSECQTLFQGWEGNYAVSCVRFHPQQQQLLYAASHAGTLHCIDIENIDNKAAYSDPIISEKNNEINSFGFGSNGNTLITGGTDAVIRVYDTTTNQKVGEYKKPHWSKTHTGRMSASTETFHEKRIYCVKIHPDEPNLFVTGGWDEVVKMWDVRVKEGCIQNIIGPYIYGDCLDIIKGRLLTASCVATNSLELWDLGSGKLISNLSPCNKRVYLYGEFPYTAQFYRGDSSGDLVLTGGSGLKGLQVISIANMSIVYLFEDEKPIVSADSCEGKVTFGGKSSSLLIANLYVLGDPRISLIESEVDVNELTSVNQLATSKTDLKYSKETLNPGPSSKTTVSQK